MAGPGHFFPVAESSQQFQMQSSSSNDEVVIYFQNFHNRLSGNAAHQQLPRISNSETPINFTVSPANADALDEHEAAYFLSRMSSRDIGVSNQGIPVSIRESSMSSRDLPVSNHDAHVSDQDNPGGNQDATIQESDHAVGDNSTPRGRHDDGHSTDSSGNKRSSPITIQTDDACKEIIKEQIKPTRRMTPEEKVAFNRLKHPMKPPCKCPRKCSEKITKERQTDINNSFWGLSYVERAMFLMSHVKRTTIHRKTVRGLSRRNFTMRYTLFDEKDHLISVCKLFFLATLGYQSDKVITRLFIKNPVGTLIPEDDMRGKHTPANKIDTQVIKEHIQFFCKQFGTSNRNLKRLHAPFGVTKMQMYNDFKARNKDFKCGPSRYSQVLKEMNVVFGKKKKPEKVPKPTTSAEVPSRQCQAYKELHNQGQTYNRGSNFQIPIAQGPSQVIMYSGQNSRTLPTSTNWGQVDYHQIYQNHSQYVIGNISDKDQGPIHDFTDQACVMMTPTDLSRSNTDHHDQVQCVDSGDRVEQSAQQSVSGPSSQTHMGDDLEQSSSQKHSKPSTPKQPRTEEEQKLHKRMKYPHTSKNQPPKTNWEQVEHQMFQNHGQYVIGNISDKDQGPSDVFNEEMCAMTPTDLSLSGIDSNNRVQCLGRNNADRVEQPSQYSVSGHSSQTHVSDDSEPITSQKQKKAKASKRPRTEEEKKAYKRMKYPLLPPCKCPKMCFEQISEERRSLINYLYWGLQYQMRAMFLLNHVKQSTTKRHRGEEMLSRRKFSRKYTLPDEKDNLVSVCKVFFLHTLGYTSDSVITKLLRKNPVGTLVPVGDNRGKHEAYNKVDTSTIRDHIRTYQRKAKGKLRLPTDVNVKQMFRDFKIRNCEFKCGYELYRRVVREMQGRK